jgi:hypothetical protein
MENSWIIYPVQAWYTTGPSAVRFCSSYGIAPGSLPDASLFAYNYRIDDRKQLRM